MAYDWSISGDEGDSEPLLPPPVRVEVGDVVEDYTILGELGRGGMGVVYRARHGKLDREVALKIVGSERGLSEAQRERFRREGRLTAALTHEGIVRVHGTGEIEGCPFLVYELVEEAVPLLSAFERAPLGRRAEWIRDAARALGHAHAQGVVHRDVKPANLLVDRTGKVRVTDFGLAAGRGLQRLTQTGAMIGTPTHMAPEQFTGGAIGPQADVWGLGVVLYQALTGRLPFESTNLLALAGEVTEARVSRPGEVDPSVPSDLEAVCLKALARDPEQRYPNGEALAAELDSWLRGGRVSTGAEPLVQLPSRRSLALWATLAIALVGLGLALSYALSQAPPPAPLAVDDPPPQPVSRPAPPPTPPPVEPSREPAWFLALPEHLRPPRIPKGMSVGETKGEYHNAKDGSILVWVPGGTFVMGSTSSSRERPTHRVEVSGYFIGKYEVSGEQFAAYGREVGRDGHLRPPYPHTPKHPAVLLSWKDARAYCDWAGLRLPSEAQWEFAARGNDGRRFPWGDDPAAPDTAMHKGVGALGTKPVGSFPAGASPFGCLDMAGNVFEWVLDGGALYRSERSTDPMIDPEPAPSRVIRGGCYDSPAQGCTGTYRDFAAPETWTPWLGFRVSRGAD